MNVVIVYANPNPKSLNAAMLEQVKRGLEDGKHTYTLLNLYQEKFKPVLVVKMF